MRFKLEAPPPAVKARAPPSKKKFEASLEKAKVKKKKLKRCETFTNFYKINKHTRSTTASKLSTYAGIRHVSPHSFRSVESQQDNLGHPDSLQFHRYIL